MTGDARRPDYKELIPELRSYPDGVGAAVEIWLTNFGRYDHAAAYASLFWPGFTEIDGCVLLGDRVPETYTEWKARLGGDLSAIESVLNHRHLSDLFMRGPEPHGELLEHLGEVLRDMWAAKLHQDFPDRQFVVTFNSAADDPEITFCSRRRDV
jgi:hypothetical protein